MLEYTIKWISKESGSFWIIRTVGVRRHSVVLLGHRIHLHIDAVGVSTYSLKSLLSGFSLVYQRADVSGRPVAVIRSRYPCSRPVCVIDRLAAQGALRSCILRVMADDFRCQVKQIIADFKAAERIIGDISVGIVAVAVALWAVIAEELAALLIWDGPARRRRW